MNMRNKNINTKLCINVISKTKDLQTSINRLPSSIKKDESGITQTEKRKLLNKIDGIKKEMIYLMNNIEEES
jgi:hypothetical protein